MASLKQFVEGLVSCMLANAVASEKRKLRWQLIYCRRGERHARLLSQIRWGPSHRCKQHSGLYQCHQQLPQKWQHQCPATLNCLNSAVHASSQSYLAQEMTKGVGFRPGIGSFAFKPYTSVLYPFSAMLQSILACVHMQFSCCPICMSAAYFCVPFLCLSAAPPRVCFSPRRGEDVKVPASSIRI